jgi:hypothetical protein
MLTDQMVKLLAYLDKLQSVELSLNDRGLKAGADVNLDFFASTAIASTRTTVRLPFLNLNDNKCLHKSSLSRGYKILQTVPLQTTHVFALQKPKSRI